MKRVTRHSLARIFSSRSTNTKIIFSLLMHNRKLRHRKSKKKKIVKVKVKVNISVHNQTITKMKVVFISHLFHICKYPVPISSHKSSLSNEIKIEDDARMSLSQTKHFLCCVCPLWLLNDENNFFLNNIPSTR